MHSCLSMNLFATFAFLLPGHPTLSTTFDYLKQRKKTAEKIDTNAQWFHCSWSILLKRVNIRVRGFHLVKVQYIYHEFKLVGAQTPTNCSFATFATSQNAAPATTSRKATSQSAAPATKKRHACIDTLPKNCACHAKHENDLTFCDLGTPKRAFRARLPPLFIL